MKKPDFFILGAPKCGTTALAFWLAQHPEVYMSPVKEPHFFNTDHKDVATPSLAVYESYFEQATDAHRAVGEASVWYLQSKVAVPNILKYSPDARFIVLVRNPVDMAHSLHEQEVFNGNENEPDFSRAWSLRDERAKGNGGTVFCKEPQHLDYGSACLLGAQVQRLYQGVDSSRVCLLLLDDMRDQPDMLCRRVLNFLGVSVSGYAPLERVNSAKTRKSGALQIAVRALGAVKRRLGVRRKGLGLLEGIKRWNVQPRPRPKLDPALRSELTAFFAKDVKLLETFIKRDLSHWMAEYPEPR